MHLSLLTWKVANEALDPTSNNIPTQRSDHKKLDKKGGKIDKNGTFILQ